MKRAAWMSLLLVGLTAVFAFLQRRRRGAQGTSDGGAGHVRRVDLPEAIGEPAEELREVHEHVAALPRLGPEEAEAESRTRPSGLTLYELRGEEEAARRRAVHHSSKDPLAPEHGS